MAKTVRVPDPVYEKIDREANDADVRHGAIVREWMEKADKYERMEGSQYR